MHLMRSKFAPTDFSWTILNTLPLQEDWLGALTVVYFFRQLVATMISNNRLVQQPIPTQSTAFQDTNFQNLLLCCQG